MATIQITSTNYNGQTAQITFYSVTAPTTAVNLGPQTLPYSRSGDDVYGSYELNFTAYNKVCVVTLNGTTTTTTTTTAAPTTTTTAAPGVTGYIYTGGGGTTFCPDIIRNGFMSYTSEFLSLSYAGGFWFIEPSPIGAYGPIAVIESSSSTPPLTGWNNGESLSVTTCAATSTTTTTTTAAPTVGFTGIGDWNGISFCPAGIYDGVNYYTNTDGPPRVMFRDGGYWYFAYTPNNEPGTSNLGGAPDAYILSNSVTPPLSGWSNSGDEPSSLGFTSGGTCSSPTTTTTTAAPTAGYTVSGATYEPDVNGTYSVAGSINGTTYYSKTLGGTFYLHKSIDSFSNDYPEWNITSWPPCEGGTRDCFSSGPAYYTLTAPSSPPVSGWWNPGYGEDTTMTVTVTE